MMASSILKLQLLCSTAVIVAMALPVTFDTNFVELDTSKMIHTSDSNYAICNHNFPNNWRSVSVNGDELTIATRDNKYSTIKFSTLSASDSSALAAIKSTLTSVIRLGPFNVKSTTGLAKLTTFDRNGGTSTMGTGGGSSSSSSSSSSSGGMSISKTGPNSFIISKQDFPFNWNRVFVNEDVATVVYRDGRVIMLPESLMKPDERAKLVELRAEVEKSSKAAEDMTKSLTQSLNNPMDFVNKAFSGMFGRR